MTYCPACMPMPLGESTDWIARVSCSCGVLVVADNGAVLAVGSNSEGQLGDGTTTNARTAVAILGVFSAIAATAGAKHTVIVLGELARIVFVSHCLRAHSLPRRHSDSLTIDASPVCRFAFSALDWRLHEMQPQGRSRRSAKTTRGNWEMAPRPTS